MLTWIQTEAFVAVAATGHRYTVVLDPFPTGRPPFVAVVAFENSRGRQFESVVGRFNTAAAAKTACENDAKGV